jgi:hypothetical protein
MLNEDSECTSLESQMRLKSRINEFLRRQKEKDLRQERKSLNKGLHCHKRKYDYCETNVQGTGAEPSLILVLRSVGISQ